MNSRKILEMILYCLVTFLVCFFLVNWLLPSAEPVMTKPSTSAKKKVVTYVAIGDSLTKGVGDSTNQGGFVPLLAQSLTNETGLEFKAINYGVSGNTSGQILSRMQEKKEIGKDLKQAQLLTITIGGNDLRKAILEDTSNLDLDRFEKASKTYEKNLKQIIELARKDNPDLPVYVVGIYNPLYLNFPDLTELQTLVDQWNQRTEETLSAYQGVYFVPINDLFYKGIDGKSGVTESELGKETVTNDALYDEDSFHPNNTGYEIMKEAVLEKIHATEKKWFE
ncbi:SGNH/GDSL hydrolase family protein [Streptococcus xiaochunlingii]|uniref:SGNH/GDSL hydrolase family protein n=1 Tax=Streptococcus xiaochunlingii TaxID=2589788 RepID=UPI002553002A|nr:SGNH/GDSL hydrolase family protein [Streptococcus xiaochunlingii]MDK8385875.1 SGNH/GDSL hydrolase family protein [Streptococcus xiaochunlingii]MDK8778373.1 SGNH/GDSL hydrolase family protein [Streptococcus xiaochunlingii]